MNFRLISTQLRDFFSVLTAHFSTINCLTALSLLFCSQINSAAEQHVLNTASYDVPEAHVRKLHWLLTRTGTLKKQNPSERQKKAREIETDLAQLLVEDSRPFIENTWMPAVSALVWGGEYPASITTIILPACSNRQIKMHQQKDQGLVDFFRKAQLLEGLHTIQDKEQVFASQLTLYRGFPHLISRLPKDTLIAPTPHGCLLLDMLKAKQGLIKVVDHERKSGIYTLNYSDCEWNELITTHPTLRLYLQHLQQLQHVITDRIAGIRFTQTVDQNKLVNALQQAQAAGDNTAYLLTWLSRIQLAQLRKHGDTPDNTREKTHRWLIDIASNGGLISLEMLQQAIGPNSSLAFHDACSITDYRMMAQQLRICFKAILQALNNGTITEALAISRIKQIHKIVINHAGGQKKRTPLHWIARNALGSKEKGTPLAKLEETTRAVLLLIIANADLSAKDQKKVAVPSFPSNSLRCLIQPGFNQKSSAAFTYRDPRWNLSNKNATQRLKNINLIYEHLFGNENVVGVQKQHKKNIRQYLLNCNNKGAGTTPITFDQLKGHPILVRQYLEQTLELFDLVETLPWTELLGFVSTSDRMLTPNKIKAMAKALVQQGL